jgi:hypothetical protein
VLEYEVAMATDTVPVVLHIVGRLERADRAGVRSNGP